MNMLSHWDFSDWRDPDKRHLNMEFIITAGAFSVVVLAVFFIGLLA